jgi:hypothetical protein
MSEMLPTSSTSAYKKAPQEKPVPVPLCPQKASHNKIKHAHGNRTHTYPETVLIKKLAGNNYFHRQILYNVQILPSSQIKP